MSLGDSAAAVSPAEDRVARRAGDRNPDAVELYKVIYDESVRLLSDQLQELAAFRTRTVQYLALIGTATAFLVGTGLSGGHRDDGFFVLAGIASAAFVVTLLYGMQVLTGVVHQKPWFTTKSPEELACAKKKWHTPRLNFYFSARALSTLADNPIEVGKDKYYGVAAMLKKLALDAEKYHDENERLIDILKHAYQLCILSGFFQLLLWGAVAWRYGGSHTS